MKENAKAANYKVRLNGAAVTGNSSRAGTVSGVGYEDYRRHHSVRIRVEKRREKDYNMCRRMAADLDKLHHYNNRLKR